MALNLLRVATRKSVLIWTIQNSDRDGLMLHQIHILYSTQKMVVKWEIDGAEM
mgnify:CR=1 FL=1